MRRAMSMAQKAAMESEVPVGAVLVREQEVVGEGWNRPVALHDPSAHAEILALRSGAQALRNYRLQGCTLYVTLEPCAMCVGAMLHARIERLVFAAYDPKAGAVGSVFDLLQDTRHNHAIRVTAGIMADEASQLLKDFFAQRRESSG